MDLGQENIRRQLSRYPEWIKKYFPDSKIFEDEGWKPMVLYPEKLMEQIDTIKNEDVLIGLGQDLLDSLAILDGYVLGYLTRERGDFYEVWRIYEDTLEERKGTTEEGNGQKRG